MTLHSSKPPEHPLSTSTRPTAQGVLDRTPWFHLLAYCLDHALTGRLDVHIDASQITSICFHTGHPAAAIIQRRTANGVESETQASVADTVIDMFTLQGAIPYAYFDGVSAIPSGTPATPCDLLSLVWAGLGKAKPWAHVSGTLAKLEGAPMAIDEARLARFTTDESLAPLFETLRAGPATLETLVAQRCTDTNTTGLLAYALLVTKCVRRAPPVLQPASSSGRALGRVQLKTTAASPSATVVEETAFDRRFDPRSSSASIKMPDLKNAISSSMRGAKNSEAPPSSRMPMKSSPSIQMRAVNSSGPTSSRGMIAAIPMPTNLTDEQRARVEEIQARAKSITKENYFDMLDVKRDATKEQVQQSFVALAKRWHPDRLPEALLFVRDDGAKVFSMLSEAHSALTDDKKRANYIEAMAAGVGTHDDQRKLEAVLEAANEYQKALIYLKKGDTQKAEELAKHALALDAEQADYLALTAWLSSQKTDGQSASWTLSAIETLTRALKMNENCERAYFYRASLYKRMGNTKASVADFRKSVELNPRNLEATREIRVYEMRSGGSEPPPSQGGAKGKKGKNDKGGGGFLGKFLKR